MSQPRILFLAANPGNTTALALDHECAAVERELRLAPYRDFELASRWVVTVDEMMRHLNELAPVVVHFAGHGTAGSPVTGPLPGNARDVDPIDGDHRGGIYLVDDHGGPQLVTAHALTAMIKHAAASVRLVVLNACYSEAQADALSEAVDCVIGMTGAIADDAARVFAAGLYRALGNRRSIGNALAQAAATLAGRQLPDDALPTCRTRRGVDADQMFLTGSQAAHIDHGSAAWGQRLDAVTQLCLDARDRLGPDPWGAAMRARRAVEHIVEYLHQRELGPSEPGGRLDTRLRQVKAKLVIPPMIANHFDFVQNHTSSILDAEGAVVEPRHLQPCLDSLAVAVDWFFREYLKDARPRLGRDLESMQSDTAPDATPHSTIGSVMNSGTRFGSGVDETIGVWRPSAVASRLRLDAPDGTQPSQCVFTIEQRRRTHFLGRSEQRWDGTRNDLVIPDGWSSVSRNQATLASADIGVVLVNTSRKDNVYVRGEPVASGASRVLHHGDPVQLGSCIGHFSDGRYYPTASALVTDRRTGLLSRTGLITEIASSLWRREPCVLFAGRCPEEPVDVAATATRDIDRIAAATALAIHAHDPAIRIGRIGTDVVALLRTKDAASTLAAIVDRVAGTACVSGFAALTGTADEAAARLEACLSALNRLAISGRAMTAPQDLTRHALAPMSVEEFAARARALHAAGGGAVLFTPAEIDRLEQIAPQAVPALELELVEMLGGRMGPREIVSLAGRGSVLFGTASDAEGLAHEAGVAWHARGPVITNALEIDRSLSAHLLTVSDLERLPQCIAELRRGDALAGTSALPAPLALVLRALHDTHDPGARARAVVSLTELVWRWLAFVLLASARTANARAIDEPHTDESDWPAPWRSLARTAARALRDQPPRLRELASLVSALDGDEPHRGAMDLIAELRSQVAGSTPAAEIQRRLPRLERALRELLAGLSPLHGWTLIAIMSSEIVDVSGSSQYIEYIDYTGPNARGSQQHVTLSGYPPLGRFTYLVRWSEGIAIALEPHVRRVCNGTAIDHELCLAETAIREPGSHRYRSVASGLEVELQVTPKQLGSRR